MRRITMEREKLGYNLTDFAKKINVAPNTLHNYESGERNVNVQMLSKMADIFDCSVDYLIGRTDIRNAKVIEDTYNGENVKVQLDQDYYNSLTPAQVKEMLENLKAVGFDVKKLLS